jgi:hypothetical protein
VDEAAREAARERGRLGGKKSGEVRRARAELRADLKARQLFVDAAEEVAQELLDAALVRGKWASLTVPLDAKERVAILKTCLEYGVGRPRAQDPMAVDEADKEGPKTGFRFGVAEAQDEGPQAEPPDAPQP